MMAECSPMSTLGDGNLTELYVGYVQVSYLQAKDKSPMLYGW